MYIYAGCKEQIIEVSVLDWTSSVDHFMSSHDKLDCIVATGQSCFVTWFTVLL